VSYDPLGERAAASCTADGLTLDRACAATEDVLLGLHPFRDIPWLEDYERVYGLPGPCFTGAPSLDERIVQLAVALRERRGVSREFYYWLAGVFGYSITIREYRPFIAGSKAGDPLSNGLWRYVWTIRARETPVRAFRAGRSNAGEPLRVWGDDRFECIFRSLAPAHTVLYFSYGEKT
jgi:uncharacterized protein YmfQ (DUF2313 family)